MFTKLRKLLGVESEDERIQRLISVTKQIADLSKSIDESADLFTERNEAFKSVLSSDKITEDVKERVKVKHTNLIKSQGDELRTFVKQRNELREKHKELMHDSKIMKAVTDLSFYENIQEKYKNNEINKSTYNLLLKAKQGKVKYADNIVRNEEGKILILQRTRVEDDKNGGKWVVPGGHVDAGEEFCEAAQRELKEESGVDVEDLTEIGVYEDENAEIHYFESYVKENETQVVLQNGESESYLWIDVNDIEKYEMPFNMAENLIKILCPIKPEITKIEKAIEEGRLSKELGEELIEKARAGVYSNTPENRKLGRVGQKYGTTSTETENKKIDEIKNQDEIADKYRNLVKDLVKEIDPEKNYTPTVSQTDHGTSVYIQNFGHGKIRFSDHSVSNPVRMSEEIHYKLSDLTDNYKRKEIKEDIEKVLFPDRFKKHEASVLGGTKVVLPPTKENIEDISVKYWEDKVKNEKPIEVPESKVWHDDEIVSERVSNSGNKLVTVKRTYKNVYRQFLGKGGVTITSPKQVENESEKKEFYGMGKKEVKLSIDDKIKPIEKAYLSGTISEEIFEKARTGKYSDTAENRSLKRVGQPYGSKKVEDTKEEKEGKKEPEADKKQGEEKTIEEHARTASETALQNAAKSGDEEHRIAAKAELDRREKEESPQEEAKEVNVSDLDEKGLRDEIKKIDEKLAPLNEELDKLYSGLGLFGRISKKKENKEWVELTSKQSNLRESLIKLKESEDKKSKPEKEKEKDGGEVSEDKKMQFDIIQKTNPMLDEYHVGIRKPQDIKTFDEVVNDEESFVWGDFSKEDAEKALKEGEITLYSSKPINQGVFVSTSKIQAEQYAGGAGKKIHSKKVKLEDVAWINGDEGQFASIEKKPPLDKQSKTDTSSDKKGESVSIDEANSKIEQEIEKSEQNDLKGGKADNLSLKDIAEKHKVSVEEIKKQLKMGINVEMEHTDEPNKAMEIAMDHLTESASYYTELEKMESKF